MLPRLLLKVNIEWDKAKRYLEFTIKNRMPFPVTFHSEIKFNGRVVKLWGKLTARMEIKRSTYLDADLESMTVWATVLGIRKWKQAEYKV